MTPDRLILNIIYIEYIQLAIRIGIQARPVYNESQVTAKYTYTVKIC